MSRWVDRVQQHAVWPTITSVETSVNSGLSRDGISPEMVDHLERLRAVVKFAEARLSATEPLFIPSAALENLILPLNQLKAHVDTFIGNGDLGQLAAANGQADTFLINLNLIFGTTSPSELQALSATASAYRQTLDRLLSESTAAQARLMEKSAANDSRLTTIESTLTAEQQRLSSLLTEQQSQFSSAQDKRASEFSASQAEYLAKYTDIVSEQKTQFSADQDSRRTAFSDFQRESQEKLADLLASYDKSLKDQALVFSSKEKEADEINKKNIQALKEDYEKQAQGILSEIKKHKSDVEQLVGVIGNLGVTSGYKKVANYARVMVGIWQFLTVLSLGGLVFVAAMVAFPSFFKTQFSNEQAIQRITVESKVQVGPTAISKPTIEKEKPTPPDAKGTAGVSVTSHSDSDFYQGFLTRIFLSITFGIFAAYAGRQASRFFDMEQKNRKLALEVEARGPFIEPLDKADRDKFRVQIGDRSFGVPDSESSNQKEDDPVTALSVLKSKEISEFITNIVKAAKS